MTHVDRWVLLEEVERDPEDVGYIEIEEVLDAFGITDTLPGEDPLGQRLRVHPLHRGFPIYYPLIHRIPSRQVKAICRAIRELNRRAGGHL